MIGRRLGCYEIVERLGAGGMGEVYRAHDSRLGRDVALKCLPERVARDPDRLARFEQEARTVAALNHPGIVTLHSIEEIDGVRFLTMERIEGESLDRIVRPGGLPLARIFDIVLPLCEALAAAHDKGIIHRDLKPANVMVTRDGRVKVLDFGLATSGRAGDVGAGDATSPASIMGSGSTGGTLPYMAPEQLREEEIDARADVFALGVMLHELATGRRPFSGSTTADVVSCILRDPAPPLGRGDLPNELERIVGRCLAKDPGDRFQSARDAGSALGYLQKALHAGTRAEPAAHAAVYPSIAVLPFVNLSGDQDNEYFADGLSEELLNVLTKIKGLHVAARTSSFRFKGATEDIRSIGEQLHVATVLEGSVRKAGRRVRITAQLVKVADGYHLWSQTYDRQLDDIFAVQDDIAHSVLGELHATLLGRAAGGAVRSALSTELHEALRGRGCNADAYRLYLQGRYFTGRQTGADLERAVQLFHESIERDPGYALAWAGLSDAWCKRAESVWVPVREGFEKAREAAKRSLELEPSLPEALVALGRIRMLHDFDWTGAEACFSRALELAPGDAQAVLAMGALALSLGRTEEAIALGLRAVSLDPLSVGAHVALGFRYHRAGQLAAAETEARSSIALNPQAVWPHFVLGLVHLARRRTEEADPAFRTEPHEPLRLLGECVVAHELGDDRRSDAALARLRDEFGDGWAVQVAQAHGHRAEREEAFRWLDRAWELRDSGLTEIKTDPLFATLHADPRWPAFLARMGLA
jgi:TolB-like protein/Tfp pilus assembly protein PilF